MVPYLNLKKSHLERIIISNIGIHSILVLTLCVFLFGCSGPSGGLDIQKSAGPNPWTHLEIANNPDNFQFAVIADLTAGLRPCHIRDSG